MDQRNGGMERWMSGEGEPKLMICNNIRVARINNTFLNRGLVS